MLKTQKNAASVEDFVSAQSPEVQADCRGVLSMMESITGEKAAMWGASIVGFGEYAYKNKTGKESKWFVTGFSPRKRNLTVYITQGFAQHGERLAKLGKHSTGVGCLYVKRLSDIDLDVLKEMVQVSVLSVLGTEGSR